MISANKLKSANPEYQNVLDMVEGRIKKADKEDKATRVVINFKDHTKYGESVVAELHKNGYFAEVVYQNTMQGGGVNLKISWNRDTSQPVTWWEQFKHSWF